MKIFISWSGDLSREIGEIFRKWVPGVLQVVKPYFTPDDVEKGTRWNVEIAKELEQSQIGIMLLTKDNLESEWMMFEAGALSKQMDKSHICPILFGIENTDLKGPLVQFQTTPFSKEEIRKLIRTINNSCGDQKLDDNVLNDVFDMWWPKLETDISSIISKHKDKPEKKIRSERDLMEEILSLVRVSTSFGSNRPFIHPEALAEIDRYFNRLCRACEHKDIEEIDEFAHRLRPPIEYILDKLGRDRIEDDIIQLELARHKIKPPNMRVRATRIVPKLKETTEDEKIVIHDAQADN